MSNDHVQPLADRIKSAFDDALAALIARRDQQYADETRALDAEREALVKEHAAIGETAENLRELLPAKAREAQREADKLVLAGKREEARAKIAEMEQAEHAPVAMQEQQREISARIHEIDGEKEAVAKTVFAEGYGACQVVVRVGEKGLFGLLDGLERSFYAYQDRTNTGTSDNRTRPLVNPGTSSGLTADERSPEWASSQRWYGVGGRR